MLGLVGQTQLAGLHLLREEPPHLFHLRLAVLYHPVEHLHDAVQSLVSFLEELSSLSVVKEEFGLKDLEHLGGDSVGTRGSAKEVELFDRIRLSTTVLGGKGDSAKEE